MKKKKKDKTTAGILALFFGWLGLHRVYLGQINRGAFFTFLTGMALYKQFNTDKISWLAVLWIPIALLVGIVDAIAFFTMEQERFDKKYNRQTRRDHSTDFERRDRSTDFERDQKQQPPRQRREYNRRKHIQKTAARQNHFNKNGKEKFAEYDYEGAIVDFKKSLEIDPANVATHFNLACAYSLTEHIAKSFYHLELAVAHGFRDFKKIQDHHALAYLRIQSEFEDFVKNEYRMPRKNEVASEEKADDLLASQPDLLDQLNKLAEMRKQGFLTEKEFEVRKEILLQQTQ